jgi:thiol-disulfide isomerase/thioredoxin
MTRRLFYASVLAGVAMCADARADTDIARYRGQVLVLNYWASWCDPCRNELPSLEHVHRRYAGRGLATLGISIDELEERDAARRLVRDLRITFPIRLDGTTKEMFAFGLATSIPATAIFDRDGARIFRIIGEAKEADLVARVEWLLGDRTGPKPSDLVLPAGVTPEHFAKHEAGEDDDDEHHGEEAHEEEGGSAVPT